MTSVSLGTLVERDTEVASIDALATQSIGGHGSLVVVLGGAGLGKTALVRRTATASSDVGLTSLTATARELDGVEPFGLLRQLLDRGLMALDEETQARVTAGPAESAARHVLGPAAAEVDPAAMLTSFYWLVDALASRGPLALTIDDAHWADQESLLFLVHLAGRLSDLPVLVVVAARDLPSDHRTPPFAALVADRDATVLELQPLSAAGVADLMAREGGEGVHADEAVELTGGNPFLVTALAALVRGGGTVDRETLQELVPRTVVDSVVRRLAALPVEDGALAKAVAVLETAPLRLAAALSGVSPATAAGAADRLRVAGLLAEDGILAFRHALLRSAVLSSIGPSTLDELRRRAARMLADEVGGRHAAVAQLMASEGVGDRWAVQTLVGAADAALASGAPRSAVAILRRAAAEPPPAADRPAVLLKLGLAQLRDADPECVNTLNEAKGIVADPDQRARCALALAAAYAYAGFHALAADELEQALGAEGSDDGLGLERELALELESGLIAASLLVPDRIASARARLADFTDLTGATRGERLLLIQQAANASGTNQHAEVIKQYARSAIGDWSTAEQRPDSTEWAWARLFLCAAGEYDEVRRLADEAERLAVQRGSVIGAVTVWFVRGMAEWWAGDLQSAEADFAAMLEVGELVAGGTLVQTLGIGGLAQTLAEQGRVDDAIAVLSHFPEELPPDAPVNGVVLLLRARALARSAAGDHEGALRAADECERRVRELDVDSPTWASWRSLAIGPLVALGRAEEAYELAAQELALAERSQVPRIVGQALRLTAMTGSRADVELLQRAREVLEGSGARLEHAKVLVALGAALRRAGRRLEAREILADARDLAARCGAAGLVAEAGTELAASGARPRRFERTGLGSLTASELRVCELAATGLRNREIAQRLFVTPKTVEVHLSASYRKLQVSGREELAAVVGRGASGAQGASAVGEQSGNTRGNVPGAG